MVTTTKTPTKIYPFSVAGKWLSAGKPLEVVSPYDGTPAGVTYWATADDLERAIQAAVSAFETTRRMPAYERQCILRAISEAIANRREEFTRLMALEAG